MSMKHYLNTQDDAYLRTWSNKLRCDNLMSYSMPMSSIKLSKKILDVNGTRLFYLTQEVTLCPFFVSFD